MYSGEFDGEIRELHEIMHRMKRIMSSRSGKGNSRAEHDLLFAIKCCMEMENSEVTRVSSVVKHMDVPAPLVSRGLKSLEELEWIFRETDPDNRRNTLIFLTTAGKEMAAKIEKERHEFLLAVISHMGHEETRRMNEDMNLFLDSIEAVFREMETSKESEE